MNVIGPQVRKIRESKNLTQEELAARCNVLGWNISRGTLAKIESQVRGVTDFEVVLLAKALKVKLNDLYKNTDHG
jgi:transcriptional regulator with XRE-family HTH domain